MPEFPSLQWFEAVRDIVSRDGRLRRFGTCDTVFCVKARDRIYEITFEAFDCTGVREATAADAENADFWLEAPFETWREILENIKQNGRADRRHTLNTIDFLDPEGLARSNDQSRKDKFYRYGETLQGFFDASAEIQTVFPALQPT